MKFVIIAPEIPTKKWTDSFKKLYPQIPILIGDKTKTPEEVTLAMVWKQKHGVLSKFKNLSIRRSLWLLICMYCLIFFFFCKPSN